MQGVSRGYGQGPVGRPGKGWGPAGEAYVPCSALPPSVSSSNRHLAVSQKQGACRNQRVTLRVEFCLGGSNPARLPAPPPTPAPAVRNFTLENSPPWRNELLVPPCPPFRLPMDPSSFLAHSSGACPSPHFGWSLKCLTSQVARKCVQVQGWGQGQAAEGVGGALGGRGTESLV